MSGIEIRACGRYRLQSVVKKTEKHSIYSAINVQTDEEVIIKAEQCKGKRESLQSILTEGKIMQGLQGGIGVPSMYWCGQEQDYNFIVMEYLGKSLQQQYERCSKKFTLKTVLMIGEQLINILQYIHFKNFIHRDISPSNFLIGRGKKNNKIFLIDYSSTRRYRDAKTLEHYPFRNTEETTLLNYMFSSLNVHKGIQATRRDDVESMILILIYFLKGLPWQDVQESNTVEKSKAVLILKQSTSIDQLCSGLPKQFNTMMKHVRSLGFQDKPDYTYFKNVFKQRMNKQGILNDYIFDWVLLPYEKTHISLDHYPLKIEVIPNQEEFIRTHLDMFKKDEDIGSRQQKQQIAEPQPMLMTNEIKNLKTGKQKDCLLF